MVDRKRRKLGKDLYLFPWHVLGEFELCYAKEVTS
jgi:hypothetical protein